MIAQLVAVERSLLKYSTPMNRLVRASVACCAAIGAAVVLVGAATLVQMKLHGASAHAAPSAAEAFIARAIRNWSVPHAVERAANPVPKDDAVITEARRHFADHCATCHANDGSGDTALGRSMYPRPPDLRSPASQQLTDGQLFYFIEHGIRLTGMPGSGDGSESGARSSWQLVRFIRHLPALTDAELAEMRSLNPKSAGEWRAEDEERAFLAGQASDTHGPH